LLAASLAITSYVITAQRGLFGSPASVVRYLLNLLEFGLLGGGMTALYRYVPNTTVRWAHAAVGGFLVATSVELAKKGLALYLGMMPTYSAVYGAFATVPILLVWIYVAWVIVLLGAVTAAYLPSLLSGVARRGGAPGWEFTLALEAISALHSARSRGVGGLDSLALASALGVNPVQLEGVLETLAALDWVGQINHGDGRYVLLADPDTTAVAPLADRLLLRRAADWPILVNNPTLSMLAGHSLLQNK
jgi:membrane protein